MCNWLLVMGYWLLVMGYWLTSAPRPPQKSLCGENWVGGRKRIGRKGKKRKCIEKVWILLTLLNPFAAAEPKTYSPIVR